MVAVRERNTGVIRRGDDGRNARHDFKLDFRRRECLGFFRAATKNVRIAALEPHDSFSFARFFDDQVVDLFLRKICALAARNDFRLRAREPEQNRIHEQVINDHVRAPEQFRAAQREQARVARPGADEINCAFGFHAPNLSERRRRAIIERKINRGVCPAK